MVLLNAISLILPVGLFAYFHSLPGGFTEESFKVRNENALILTLMVAVCIWFITKNVPVTIGIAVIGFGLWYLSQ